jgi:signal transduction histidine kinase
MSAKEKVNILMVDDQPAKLLSYEVILGELDENLIKAKSGQEAFECLLKTDVAVVLMDVSMPEIDGFEVAAMIRQHPRFQKTAIIFISAVHLTDMDRIKGYERGAADYISVPIVPELLRAKVSVFAELHRRARQLESMNLELERRANALKVAEEDLRLLSAQLMRSQDDERRRIARELHDGLGQYLIAIKMRIDSLHMQSQQGTNLHESLEDVVKQIDKAISETRTMSSLLHPPLLDEIGLESALRWLADGFSARSGISLDVSISPEVGRLEAAAETALFRVVQECLTNIHRHSGSPTASIYLTHNQGEIRLEVRDQGKGIAYPSGAKRGPLGIGMQSIRERIRHLQGEVDIVSQKGKGTNVVVTIPDTLRVKESASGLQEDLKICESGAS